MATFRFTGKVLPTFKEFTMIGSFTANWNEQIDPPVSLVMSATLTITKGIIEVVCESNLFGNDNYDGHVDWRAHYLAQSVLSCYAFAKGLKLDAIFETVIKPDGIKYNIQAYRSDLEPLVTALRGPDEGVDITSMLLLLLPSPTVFALFKDLVGSLDSKESLVNCARAIDGIREYMSPGTDKAQGWKLMRDNLNISQDFLKFISEGSKGPRHGNVANMQFVTINESRRRSWIVANRFLEFKKRGDKQLPLADFPLLS